MGLGSELPQLHGVRLGAVIVARKRERNGWDQFLCWLAEGHLLVTHAPLARLCEQMRDPDSAPHSECDQAWVGMETSLGPCSSSRGRESLGQREPCPLRGILGRLSKLHLGFLIR